MQKHLEYITKVLEEMKYELHTSMRRARGPTVAGAASGIRTAGIANVYFGILQSTAVSA